MNGVCIEGAALLRERGRTMEPRGIQPPFCLLTETSSACEVNVYDVVIIHSTTCRVNLFLFHFDIIATTSVHM